MTDKISLSLAEVSYLLSVADPDGSSPAYGLLSISDDDRAVAVVRAGLSSLALRGHLATDGERVALDPAVTSVAAVLTTMDSAVELGLVAPERADGAVFVQSGGARLMVAPRQFGCFDVTGLTADGDLVDHVTNVARAFLSVTRPGVAAMDVHSYATPGAPVVKSRIAVSGTGEWTVAPGGDIDRSATLPGPDEAWAAFGADLERASV